MRYYVRQTIKAIFLTGVLFFLVSIVPAKTFAAEETGSVGLEGRINAAPPTTGATISFPRDGAVITELPTKVTGICPTGLLVKIFKNNVFAGSVMCVNGSFSIPIDLFSGRNELVARVYDDLDQAGPDSNIVVVTLPFTGAFIPNRISLTSAFAKRGANPGQTLTWPITLTGGVGPYAITVDWGDGKTADIISQASPGNFNITHIYDSAGVFNIIIRATDKDGNIAFLQLVGVSNGSVGQGGTGSASGDGGGSNATVVQTKVLWQPAAITLPLLISSFWLGKRYELFVLRKRLEQGEDVS
ncbi:MAG: PKD domain-containing protein [Candidatus Saccharimonadales bacterium]